MFRRIKMSCAGAKSSQIIKASALVEGKRLVSPLNYRGCPVLMSFAQDIDINPNPSF
jgi:hypothetical protein